MPQRITIEYDGTTVSIDKAMTKAEARVWMFEQALRLTRHEPIVSPRIRPPAAISRRKREK